MANEEGYADLAPIDVEAYVSDGVPRPSFMVLPQTDWWSPTTPTFRLYDTELRRLGWRRDSSDGTLQPPDDHTADVGTPHPYALGPIWSGVNTWHVEVRIEARDLVALVDHRWARPHAGNCELGPALASGSPWRWHVVGLAGDPVCGRAETPVLAAWLAEDVLVASGADISERTSLRRVLPG